MSLLLSCKIETCVYVKEILHFVDVDIWRHGWLLLLGRVRGSGRSLVQTIVGHAPPPLTLTCTPTWPVTSFIKCSMTFLPCSWTSCALVVTIPATAALLGQSVTAHTRMSVSLCHVNHLKRKELVWAKQYFQIIAFWKHTVCFVNKGPIIWVFAFSYYAPSCGDTHIISILEKLFSP